MSAKELYDRLCADGTEAASFGLDLSPEAKAFRDAEENATATANDEGFALFSERWYEVFAASYEFVLDNTPEPTPAIGTSLDFALVADLRKEDITVTRRYRRRYGEDHPNPFPKENGVIGRSPWWSADRVDELKAWTPTGRGKGGGRPRKTTAADTPATGAQTHADRPAVMTGTDQAAPDPLAPLAPLRPINGRATNDVFRNLQRAKDDRDVWGSAGETFSFTSHETYREQAMKWLGDNSELSQKTIEAADWNEVYDYFRAQRHGNDTAPETTASEPAPAPASEPAHDPIGPRRISDNPEHDGMSLWEVVLYENRKARQARIDAKQKAKLDKAYSAPTVTDRDTAARVYVDVVEPGKAVIIGPGFQARAGVDTESRTRRYWVELSASDTHADDVEKHIGNARTYAKAGEVVAQHHGLTNYYVEVDHEIGQRS
ncbi:hypothetical protein [Lentzea kentuckyensis]|uniref:hypothetical protein n=1 Tax=Lentzea kentuckyensis TaxID=360086 RepID=UPI000A391C64|nr:hypothetical protein [Lentzea kentuckyensis]